MVISVDHGQILKTPAHVGRTVHSFTQKQKKQKDGLKWHFSSHSALCEKSHTTLNILSTFVLIEVPILVSALCFDWLINNVCQRSKSLGI